MKSILAVLLIILCSGLNVHAETEPSATPQTTVEVPWSQRSWEDRVYNSTYEDIYSFKHGQTYVLDPYVWVYSKEFAERFHMPSQWIDPGLKGALGIAWRMTTIGNITCGLSRQANNCWKPLNCQMDIYYDNRIVLPWIHPEIIRDNVMMGLSSSQFLHYPPDSRRRRYAREPSGIMNSGGGLRYGPYRQGGSQLLMFDREYEPGVGVMTWVGAGVCPEYVGPEKVLMIFFSEEDLQKFRYGKITDEKDIRVLHTIEFPEAFLRRAKQVYDVQNTPNEDVINHLMRQFFEQRNKDATLLKK